MIFDSINAALTKDSSHVVFNVSGHIDKEALDCVKSNFFHLKYDGNYVFVSAVSEHHPVSKDDIEYIRCQYKEALANLQRIREKTEKDRADMLDRIKGLCGLPLDTDCQS